jgi:hypothetical protein
VSGVLQIVSIVLQIVSIVFDRWETAK